jgi:thiamine-phosphate pyrophosphorylase
LSPILGIEGYTRIMTELKNNKIDTPIYAIGGIVLEDADQLVEAGIYGIAVSGIITYNSDKRELVEQLNYSLYANT